MALSPFGVVQKEKFLVAADFMSANVVEKRNHEDCGYHPKPTY